MYAAMTTLHVLPGKKDTMIATSKSSAFNEAVSLLQQLPGFNRLQVMVDSDSDKSYVISFYETEAHAIAAGDSPQVKEAWKKLVAYIDMESMIRTVCEVVAESQTVTVTV